MMHVSDDIYEHVYPDFDPDAGFRQDAEVLQCIMNSVSMLTNWAVRQDTLWHGGPQAALDLKRQFWHIVCFLCDRHTAGRNHPEGCIR